MGTIGLRCSGDDGPDSHFSVALMAGTPRALFLLQAHPGADVMWGL